MAVNIVTIFANNSSGMRTLYTCPAGKVAKLVFTNSTSSVSDSASVVASGAPTSNRVFDGGSLIVGGITLLNSVASNGYRYMSINPFLSENVSSATRAVGNRIVAHHSGGNISHSRYLNEAELILSGGQSVVVKGNASITMRVLEENL